MWDDILSIAYANGLWATLFVALFIYQLKNSQSREEKYQSTIKALCNELKVVENIEKKISLCQSICRMSTISQLDKNKSFQQNQTKANEIKIKKIEGDL